MVGNTSPAVVPALRLHHGGAEKVPLWPPGRHRKPRAAGGPSSSGDAAPEARPVDAPHGGGAEPAAGEARKVSARTTFGLQPRACTIIL